MSENQKTEESAADILRLEEEISNFFEDFMYDRGGSPLLGRIYALCVLNDPDAPLRQSDLQKRFDHVHASTISRNLKELENWSLITRRREPGSREWQYQVENTSFLELIVKDFEDKATTLRERSDDIKRKRELWGGTLSDDSKGTKKGEKALQVLDLLIAWIDSVENELDDFIQKLHQRFLDLEKEHTT